VVHFDDYFFFFFEEFVFLLRRLVDFGFLIHSTNEAQIPLARANLSCLPFLFFSHSHTASTAAAAAMFVFFFPPSIDDDDDVRT
jgi:hypothetical protein